MMAEIFQQRYMDETAMKFEDFLLILKENRAKLNDSGWVQN